MKTNKLRLALLLAFAICIISSVSFEKKSENIRSEIMRLHIIANSDSKKDQEIKLKIRDEILKNSSDIFRNSKNIAEAKKLTEKETELLKATAENTLRKNGFKESVFVEIGKSYFPTKQYKNITLPAGNYTALKIIVGEGKGKNWWCVLFPPLCIGAAKKDEKLLESVLSENELRLIKSNPKYEVRFWIVEKWQELKNKYNK